MSEETKVEQARIDAAREQAKEIAALPLFEQLLFITHSTDPIGHCTLIVDYDENLTDADGNAPMRMQLACGSTFTDLDKYEIIKSMQDALNSQFDAFYTKLNLAAPGDVH
jgi:hypothetical protein